MTREDWLIGVPLVAGMIVVAYGLGRGLAAIKNRRFQGAWRPLMPLVEGARVEGDGGGAATSFLHGMYRGRRVCAAMSPVRRRNADVNHFEISAFQVKGRSDWKLVYHNALPGLGTTGWRIESKDEGLAARLRTTAIMPGEMPGRTDIRWTYSASRQELNFHEEIGSLWTPSPGRFQAELDELLEIARINEDLNQ